MEHWGANGGDWPGGGVQGLSLGRCETVKFGPHPDLAKPSPTC